MPIRVPLRTIAVSAGTPVPDIRLGCAFVETELFRTRTDTIEQVVTATARGLVQNATCGVTLTSPVTCNVCGAISARARLTFSFQDAFGRPRTIRRSITLTRPPGPGCVPAGRCTCIVEVFTCTPVTVTEEVITPPFGLPRLQSVLRTTVRLQVRTECCVPTPPIPLRLCVPLVPPGDQCEEICTLQRRTDRVTLTQPVTCTVRGPVDQITACQVVVLNQGITGDVFRAQAAVIFVVISQSQVITCVRTVRFSHPLPPGAIDCTSEVLEARCLNQAATPGPFGSTTLSADVELDVALSCSFPAVLRVRRCPPGPPV